MASLSLDGEPVVIEAYPRMAHAIRFTSDGRLVTSGMDTQVKLLAPPDAGHSAWREVGWFEGHANAVTVARLNAAETRLYTASTDGTARIWSFPDGGLLHTLVGHKKTVADLTLSPDESLLATASYDSRVRLWDLGTAQERTTLKGHPRNATVVRISPGGARLASGGLGDEVLVWSVADGALLRRLASHSVVTGIVGWPDATRLLTYDYAGVLRLWDVDSGAVVQVWTTELLEIASTALSPDGTLLAATAPHTLAFFDTATWERVETLSLKVKGVYGVTWSHDGAQVACSAADGRIRIYTVQR